MAHVTLRTLTLKSKLGFGKWADLTVKEALFIKNQFRYIAWCYYNLSNISFDHEILDLIGIEHEIPKPGKDTIYYEENKELIDNTATERLFESGDMRQKFRVDRLKRKMRNDKEVIFMRSFESKYSKGALQRINHGK